MATMTERQKAAILFHILTGCKDREILFRIAEGDDRCNKLKINSKSQTFSNWYNSQIIQEGIKETIYKIEQEKKHIAEKAILEFRKNETETTKGGKDHNFNGSTNFLNRDEFLQFLNERANEVKDDKQLTDTLKMISDNLRYKDSDKEGENEQIKAYLPIQCYSCELRKRCESCKLDVCPVETL